MAACVTSRGLVRSFSGDATGTAPCCVARSTRGPTMADRIQPNPHSDQYRLERHAYGAPSLDNSEDKSWLDGLPHDFKS